MEGGRCFVDYLKERKWSKFYPSEAMKKLEYPEISLYSLLKATVEKYRNRIAIISENEQMSYLELKNKVDRLAGAWDGMGLKKGERIGLMIPNVPSYIIAYYTALRLGLIVVQINPNYTARELLQIADDSTLNYIVVEEDNLDTINQVNDMYKLDYVFVTDTNKTDLYSLESLIKKSDPIDKEVSISVEEDVAVIQYTGGTSGVMKGAMLTHRNLLANVIQSYAIYGENMQPGREIVLTATPLYHVYAMTSAMNLGIYIGATILLIKKFEIGRAHV